MLLAFCFNAIQKHISLSVYTKQKYNKTFLGVNWLWNRSRLIELGFSINLKIVFQNTASMKRLLFVLTTAGIWGLNIQLGVNSVWNKTVIVTWSMGTVKIVYGKLSQNFSSFLQSLWLFQKMFWLNGKSADLDEEQSDRVYFFSMGYYVTALLFRVIIAMI